MKFCLKLIKKYKLKLSLFFDEPDNYLNPELINELVNLMSSIKNYCSIYIALHNPYFISYLLNKVRYKDIELYRLEAKQNVKKKRKYKSSKIKINGEQYILPSLLIYEIYNVCTIDLLDYYIGEIKKYSINDDMKYEFDKRNDDEIVKMDEKIERVDNHFKKNIDKPGYIKNGNFKHYSIIHLVRNYYHHPSDRKIMKVDIDEKMVGKYKNIEVLLEHAIKNIRDLLEKNNCITYKLNYEDCNN